MAPAKVKVVTERPQSDSFKQLQCFWGFVSVGCHFLHDLNSLTAHLTILPQALLCYSGQELRHFTSPFWSTVTSAFVLWWTQLWLCWRHFILVISQRQKKSSLCGGSWRDLSTLSWSGCTTSTCGLSTKQASLATFNEPEFWFHTWTENEAVC